MADIEQKLAEITANAEEFLKGFTAYYNDPQRAVEAEESRKMMEPIIALGSRLIGEAWEMEGDYWWFSEEEGGWILQLTDGLAGECSLTCQFKSGTPAEVESIYTIVGYCTMHGIQVNRY